MSEPSATSAGANATGDATQDAASARHLELLERIQMLEHRLWVLEQRSGIPAPPWPRAAPVVVPPPLPVRDDRSADEAAPPEEVPLEEPFATNGSAPAEAEPIGEASPATSADALREVRARTLSYKPQLPPPAALREGNLEQTIGLKWAGWVGALVVVIGAGLGVKYAIDAGWFGRMPAELRLLMMALAGFGLIGAGEVVYRRVNRMSAAGLFGAGVATLFLVSYTGYNFLHVYSEQVAFILMALTTIVGAGVAVRGRLVSVAVLALLGGHVTPLIVGGQTPTLLPILSYLLMLQVVAVGLAWWGGTTRWWTLRWLAVIATGLWLAAMLAAPAGRADPLVFAFVLIYAGVFLSELILSAFRPRGPVEALDLGAGVVFSLAVTAMLVLATLAAREQATPLARGGWLLLYAAVYAVAGFSLTRAVAGRMLAVAFRTQAAALVVLSVPVALAGSAVVLVWAGMALAFGVVGARLNLAISRVASVVTWAAAVVYLIFATLHHDLAPDAGDIAFTLGGAAVPVYVVLAWGLALVGLGVAWLLAARLAGAGEMAVEAGKETAGPAVVEQPAPASSDRLASYTAGPALAAQPVEKPGWSIALDRSELERGARLLSVFAGGVWVAGSLIGLPAMAATLALVAWAWLLVALDPVARRLALAMQAIVVLGIAAAKWALVDLLGQRLGDGWTAGQLDYLPVLNPMMALGAVIAGSAVAIYWLRRQAINERLDAIGSSTATRNGALALGFVLILLVTFGLTLEIDRLIQAARRGNWPLDIGPQQVRMLSFTILWSAAAAAMAGLVIRLESDLARRRSLLGGMAVAPSLLAVLFIIFGGIVWHVMEGGVSGVILLNLEALAAAAVLGMIAVYWWPLREGAATGVSRRASASVLGLSALVVMLMIGQWELGRAMTAINVTPLARQVGISVWWALFAVATVAGGFMTRTAALRYFGLCLLALALAKVLIVDMATVDRGWRTLSFIGVGLLMLGTSVLYGKYSPKLLGDAGRVAP